MHWVRYQTARNTSFFFYIKAKAAHHLTTAQVQTQELVTLQELIKLMMRELSVGHYKQP